MFVLLVVLFIKNDSDIDTSIIVWRSFDRRSVSITSFLSAIIYAAPAQPAQRRKPVKRALFIKFRKNIKMANFEFFAIFFQKGCRFK